MNLTSTSPYPLHIIFDDGLIKPYPVIVLSEKSLYLGGSPVTYTKKPNYWIGTLFVEWYSPSNLNIHSNFYLFIRSLHGASLERQGRRTI